MAVFGLKAELGREESHLLELTLTAVLSAQLGHELAPDSTLVEPTIDGLEQVLSILKRWFDPIASGKRLREEVRRLPRVTIDVPATSDQLLIAVGGDRWLVTPEGVAVLWLIRRAHIEDPTSDLTVFTQRQRLDAMETLAAVYKSWNEQRLRGVTTLLQEETATLRPTAAGLLFVLLVNRNTDRSRRLPPPRSAAESDEVSRAIALPTLAFAHALSGQEKASERGLDLYRGWALGELARRLGEGLHSGSDGVWIDPEWELSARLRLREALAGRDGAREAVDSSLDAYHMIRPVLSGLNIAFERPSNTRRIREQLLGWANQGRPA